MDHAMNEAMRFFYEKKQRHHILKQESDAASEEYREAEQHVLDRMEELGLKTFTVDLPGIGEVRFTKRKPTVYGRIVDADAAYVALDKQGRAEEMFAPKVQASRLNELVREFLEQGIPLPDGVDFYERAGVTVSRAK
ncbi:hypothetical protein UFOVP1328_17 [uncultured Caudovirales phage]|uniref:Uncharacterized protein n=1 Tax=uncultured Caudovirales phage TaxID=2100421 RepID=A0A6J5QR32_9CAUD|nr:hypothetical protein UFOVP1084_61 [uncultured Caudovirales phage]CAB4199103.1 hypothetical protein UFOVP1328_17 [uncultured Caudovirales phage]CAB5228425.1 hypothetical protein UFOVP1532_48 [uncultured Caudovirales phage]